MAEGQANGGARAAIKQPAPAGIVSAPNVTTKYRIRPASRAMKSNAPNAAQKWSGNRVTNRSFLEMILAFYTVSDLVNVQGIAVKIQNAIAHSPNTPRR